MDVEKSTIRGPVLANHQRMVGVVSLATLMFGCDSSNHFNSRVNDAITKPHDSISDLGFEQDSRLPQDSSMLPSDTPTRPRPDFDRDGLFDDEDSCPRVFNPKDPVSGAYGDIDGDGVLDECDLCPAFFDETNDSPECLRVGNDDGDNDGVPTSWDNCQDVPNPLQEDLDHDGAGGLCDCNDHNASVQRANTVVLCDGIDDECNGRGVVTMRFDNGTVSINGEPECECVNGEERKIGSNQGICQYGLEKCEQGIFVTHQPATTPQMEVCDGIDNDCDSLVDEDCECSLNETINCGVNIGNCRNGQQICIDGLYGGSCLGEVRPTPENCLHLLMDADCDGIIAEQQLRLGEPCRRTCDIGDDQGGIISCNPYGEVFCNYLTECYPPAINPLSPDAGVLPDAGSDSENGGNSDCPNRPETCNNDDDNCNGEVDENLVRPCQNNCGNIGNERCLEGQWQRCDAVICDLPEPPTLPPQPEF